MREEGVGAEGIKKITDSWEKRDYIRTKKELHLSIHDLSTAEEALFAIGWKSAEQRRAISTSKSSIWLKTFEFLYFHKFHKQTGDNG
jgi:hypothetical protein